MNVNSFRRWLKSQIALLDDNTDSAVDRADETVPVIRQAKKIAIELALPEVASHCATVTTTRLALPAARLVLCELLAMLPNEKSDSLTPPQVARRLGVNPDKVLSWIRSGELSAVNVTTKPGGRPKYRIALLTWTHSNPSKPATPDQAETGCEVFREGLLLNNHLRTCFATENNRRFVMRSR